MVRVVAFALVLFVGAVPVAAETPAEISARGEELAKEGRFSEAISAFKAADAVEPRASHACLIALAYTRRELWSQAEIFLDLCRKRATPSDPLPDWVPIAESTLEQRLATVEVAPIQIVVTPADAHAHLTVSSFAPDEVFEPRTIHLGFGTHVITAAANGFIARDISVKIVDRSPQTITIELQPQPKPIVPPQPQQAKPEQLEHTRRGWFVVGAGAFIVGAAITLDFTWLQPARRHLVHASDPAHPDTGEYDQYEPTFNKARPITLAAYGVGAATLVTGAVLVMLDRREHRVQVRAVPTHGGAFVSLEWRR